MRKIFSLLASVGLTVLLAGCDWTWSGDDDTWDDSYSWVNFNGVYKGIDGGLLVTDYTATPGTTGTTYTVSNENMGRMEPDESTFSARLDHYLVVAGSLSITVASWTFTDDGEGNLIGDKSGNGDITYSTGYVSIDLHNEVGAANTVYATYQYKVAGTSGSGSAGAGSTGIEIYSFTMSHTGNKITIVDNNASTYSGSFSSISSYGSGTRGTTVANGDTVIGYYSVSGTSAAGYTVNMVGTFQATFELSGNNYRLTNRRLYGTWIETGGTSGDINGEASPISVSNQIGRASCRERV